MAAASLQSSLKSAADDIQLQIECPVCCETFRTPKCLNCGHSVCADCCHKLQSGNSIMCPECRHPTVVPDSGLSTNFALENLIQHLQNREDQERYRCVECDILCTANEAWISKAEWVPLPLCYHCIIVKHSGEHAASMESLTDAFKRCDDDLSEVKIFMETFSKEQFDLQRRIDDIDQISQDLCKAAMEEVKKLDDEFQQLHDGTDFMHVPPKSLEALGDFKSSIKDTTKKLNEMVNVRRDTIARAKGVLNSLAKQLDCSVDAVVVENRNDNGDDEGW